MCFYYPDDYDWIARVNEWSQPTAEELLTCRECGADIKPGQKYRKLYQQEHEECQLCEDECSETYDEEHAKAGCDHDYGENYTYRRCNDCELMVECIAEVEAEQDCPPGTRRPPLEELEEAFNPCEHDDAPLYAQRVVEKHPHLAKHKWIERAMELV
jgi:hypothetical protein